MAPDLTRQLDIVSPDDLQRLSVTIIGVGGIGSPTALALAKMGIGEITVYDPDTVESANVSSQFYKPCDIGRTKVECLAEACSDFAGVEITAIPEAYVDQPLQGVVVSGVDKMTTRSIIWDQVKLDPSIPVYIEARMGALFGIVYAVRPVDPEDIAWYETKLYSSEEAVDLPCTAKAIIFNTFGIASVIACQVMKHARGEALVRDVPVDFANFMMLT